VAIVHADVDTGRWYTRCKDCPSAKCKLRIAYALEVRNVSSTLNHARLLYLADRL